MVNQDRRSDIAEEKREKSRDSSMATRRVRKVKEQNQLQQQKEKPWRKIPPAEQKPNPLRPHPTAQTRYKNFFDLCPVPLWVEDFSAAVEFVDSLEKMESLKTAKYLEKNPDQLKKAIDLIKIVEVNQATIKLYEAKNEDQLLAGLEKVLTKKSRLTLQNELLNLVDGQTSFREETSNNTLTGKKMTLTISWNLIPGTKEAIVAILPPQIMWNIEAF